jgi:anti-sigma28 factor (negative regulator of flagellin synthesis)
MNIKSLNGAVSQVVRFPERQTAQPESTQQQTNKADDAAKVLFASTASSSSNTDKVATIRSQIESGTYVIDTMKVASKLAQELL